MTNRKRNQTAKSTRPKKANPRRQLAAESKVADHLSVRQVVAQCRSEAEQRALFEELSARGFPCRLLNL